MNGVLQTVASFISLLLSSTILECFKVRPDHHRRYSCDSATTTSSPELHTARDEASTIVHDAEQQQTVVITHATMTFARLFAWLTMLRGPFTMFSATMVLLRANSPTSAISNWVPG